MANKGVKVLALAAALLVSLSISGCGKMAESPKGVAGQPGDKTIVDEWRFVAPPAAPELKAVSVDAKTTALLILDIQKNSTDPQQRPKAAVAVPRIKQLLDLARKSGLPVVYSLTSNANPEDIAPAVAPQPGEPIVKSSVDKFYKTDLEKILADKGVKTVIVTGTASHGAVLHTAAGAAMRGLAVVVPVDCMYSDTAYPDQYTAWHMLNSPGTRNRATLTRAGLISVK